MFVWIFPRPASRRDRGFRFPPPPTKAVCLDWSITDPSQIQGTEAEMQKAYEDTFEFLKAHVHDLVEAVLSDG